MSGWEETYFAMYVLSVTFIIFENKRGFDHFN